MNKFQNGVRKLAALSLGANYPTTASLPFVMAGGFSKILGISLATDYTFPEAQKVKDILANPGAFAAASTSTSTSTAAATANKPADKPVEKPKSEESEQDMGFSLFD